MICQIVACAHGEKSFEFASMDPSGQLPTRPKATPESINPAPRLKLKSKTEKPWITFSKQSDSGRHSVMRSTALNGATAKDTSYSTKPQLATSLNLKGHPIGSTKLPPAWASKSQNTSRRATYKCL